MRLTIVREDSVTRSTSIRSYELALELKFTVLESNSPDTVRTEIRNVKGSVGTFNGLMRVGTVLTIRVGSLGGFTVDE
jgi:hypothetical protein